MDKLLENDTSFVDSEGQRFMVATLEEHLDEKNLLPVEDSVEQFTGRKVFLWNEAAIEYIYMEVNKFIFKKYPQLLDESSKSTKVLDLGEILALANNFLWDATGGHKEGAEGWSNTDIKVQISLESRPDTRCEIFNKAYIHVFEDLCSKFNPDLLETHKIIVTDSSLAMQLIRDSLEGLDHSTQSHTYCSLLSKNENNFIVTPIDPYHTGHLDLRNFNELDFSSSRGADSLRAIARLTKNKPEIKSDDISIPLDFRIFAGRIDSLILGENTSLNFSLLPIYLQNVSSAKATIVKLENTIERQKKSMAQIEKKKQDAILLFEKPNEYMRRNSLDEESFNFYVDSGMIVVNKDQEALDSALKEMDDDIQEYKVIVNQNTQLKTELQRYSEAYKSITEIVFEAFLYEANPEDILNAVVMFDEITSVGMNLDASLIELLESKLENINIDRLEERIYGIENRKRRKIVVRRSSSKLMQSFIYEEIGVDINSKDKLYADISENYLDSFYRIKLKYFDTLTKIGRLEWIRSLPETFIGDKTQYFSFINKVVINLEEEGFDIEAQKLREKFFPAS